MQRPYTFRVCITAAFDFCTPRSVNFPISLRAFLKTDCQLKNCKSDFRRKSNNCNNKVFQNKSENLHDPPVTKPSKSHGNLGWKRHIVTERSHRVLTMAEHYSKPSRRDEHRKLIFGASYFRPGRQERRPEKRNLNANFGENSGSGFLSKFFYFFYASTRKSNVPRRTCFIHRLSFQNFLNFKHLLFLIYR